MDVSTITNLIGGLGFPIAVCIVLFWFINKTLNNITTALNNNSTVMGELVKEIRDGRNFDGSSK